MPVAAGRRRRARSPCSAARLTRPRRWPSRRAQENDDYFTLLFRFGVLPAFLFSGTFFPVDQLPGWIQPIGVAHPAVARRRPPPGSSRSADPNWLAIAGHCAYLAAVGRRGGLARSPRLHPAAGHVSGLTGRLASPVRCPCPAGAGHGADAGRAQHRGPSATPGRSLVSGFFEPRLLPVLPRRRARQRWWAPIDAGDGQSVDYAVFVAPALLAASAMNGAVFDTTGNVFFKLKYARLYDSVLATPLGPRDVARRRGHLGPAARLGLRGDVPARHGRSPHA